MNIYVCIKHVPDSAARIKIVEPNRIDESVTFIINPYDENAVEEAVQLKKQIDGSEVIVVTLGPPAAENTLRSALAMGADRAILISTDSRPDSLVTAQALKAAIEGDGGASIIFTGKESIDSEGFQTMYRLAVALSIPVASSVVAFSLEQGFARVECEMEAGATAVMKMALPCVIGAGKALNQPGYPTLPAIMNARKKKIEHLDLADLDIKKFSGSMEVVELKPAVEVRQAKEIKGPPDTVAEEIIRILREEARVL